MGYSKAEITTVLSRMGTSGVTVKKLEKLTAKPERRQVYFEDMTNKDFWLAVDIFKLLGETALKTCISNYQECSFTIKRKAINLLKLHGFRPL